MTFVDGRPHLGWADVEYCCSFRYRDKLLIGTGQTALSVSMSQCMPLFMVYTFFTVAFGDFDLPIALSHD